MTNQAISFTHDAQLLTSLLAELKHEQEALIHQDLNTIEAMMTKRLTLLQQLSAAAKQRYEALSAQGYQPNELGMKDWLSKQSNPKLNQAWQIFQQSLAYAKELNRLNGALITKHSNRNIERLNALKGDHTNTQVYGKNGQARTQSYIRNALAI